jgi:hypothetical protein
MRVEHDGFSNIAWTKRGSGKGLSQNENSEFADSDVFKEKIS